MLKKYHSAIVWTLVFTMLGTPSMVRAQSPADAASSPAAAKPKLDLDYITPEAAVGVVAYPRAVLTSPSFEAMPIEILSAAGKKELGIDPARIESVLVLAEPPGAGLPGVAVILKFSDAIGSGPVLGPLWQETTEDKLDGKTYRKAKAAMGASIYQADEKTLIVGTDAMLRKVVAAHAKPEESRLKTMLGRGGAPDLMGVVLVEPLRPIIAATTMMAPLPPELASLTSVPNLIDYIAFKVNLSDSAEMMLTARANDEAAADKLEDIVDGLMATAKKSFAGELAKLEASSDPVEQAQAKYVKRMYGGVQNILRPMRKGTSFTLASHGTNNGTMQVATVGILVGLLLPAVSAAREAGRRAQSQNNMKQIILAMLNYESATRTFPPQAIRDKQGKPLLSWRVAILPYMDEDALYKQFHLNEPWDSPHNRTLIAAMPKIYQNPSSAAKPGMANYLAPCGKGLMFEGTKNRKVTEITDGTANTIALVEADDDRAVEWTKPQDWDFDAKQPLAGLGHAHPAGFNVFFADGSGHFISASIDPKLFQALLTIAGGERVQGP